MRGPWAGAGAGGPGAGLSLWVRLSAVVLSGAELVRTWGAVPAGGPDDFGRSGDQCGRDRDADAARAIQVRGLVQSARSRGR